MIIHTVAAVVAIAAIVAGYRKAKSKPVAGLHVGDTVIVHGKYGLQYKHLPPYGMNISEFDDVYATVVYMPETGNEICTTKVPRKALKVVNSAKG